MAKNKKKKSIKGAESTTIWPELYHKLKQGTKKVGSYVQTKYSAIHQKITQNPWKVVLGLGVISVGLGALLVYSKGKSQNLEHKVLNYLDRNPGSDLLDVSTSTGSSDKAEDILLDLQEQEKIKIKNHKYFLVPENIPQTQNLALEESQTNLEHKVLNYLDRNPGSSLLNIYSGVNSGEEAYNTLADLLEQRKIKIKNNKFYANK